MTTATLPNRADALTQRLFEAAIGTLELYSVYLGQRLGPYAALREPHTCGQLAEVACIDGRYVRKWLEQQAVAGLIDVCPPDTSVAVGRRYRLPAEHDGVLADPANPAHAAPFAPMLVEIAGALPDVVAAYRAGAGVPDTRYGRDFVCGRGRSTASALPPDA